MPEKQDQERVGSLALQRLWESGERDAAIRAALDSWNELMAGGESLLWLEKALRVSGLPIESTAVQAHMARRAKDTRSWEGLVESVLGTGDPWWARELLDEYGTGTRELHRLSVECDLALGDAAESIAAFQRAYPDENGLDAVFGWWIANGQAEEAERFLARSDGLPLWRARLALWRGDPQAARSLVRELPATPETTCVEAAAAVLEDRCDEAESLLRPLLDSTVRAEAWSWLATTLRKQRRYDEAVQAADSANLATPAFSLAPRIEREIAIEYGREEPDAANRSLFTRLRRRLGFSHERLIGNLEYAPLLYPLGLKPHDPLSELETAIARLGGNRTPYPTTCANGKLVSLRLPIDPRHLGAIIQLVLWTRGADAVRALYRKYAASVDGHPLFRIYEGEIELWMGAYGDAEAIFRAVVERDRMIKWAWIGLGASIMLQGDLAEAQRTWAKGLEFCGFAGPTLYVYRGECYRLQGDEEKARADLEYAIAQKPQRLSAHINLALLDEQPALLADAIRRCEVFAPILMDELSGTASERLQGVLRAMRGNRSSSPWQMSYHLWGRFWRKAI